MLLGCGSSVVEDPSGPGGDDRDCPAMCTRLEELDCDAARPLPDGSTCETWCVESETDGVLSICPAWVAQARDCGEAERLSRCGS